MLTKAQQDELELIKQRQAVRVSNRSSPIKKRRYNKRNPSAIDDINALLEMLHRLLNHR